MASRKVEDCTPALQEKIKLFDAAMKAAGIPYIITCTARKVKEQQALYAQGREDVEYVNTLRKAAGMPPIPENEDHYKVTWTLNSKHITKPCVKTSPSYYRFFFLQYSTTSFI